MTRFLKSLGATLGILGTCLAIVAVIIGIAKLLTSFPVLLPIAILGMVLMLVFCFFYFCEFQND